MGHHSGHGRVSRREGRGLQVIPFVHDQSQQLGKGSGAAQSVGGAERLRCQPIKKAAAQLVFLLRQRSAAAVLGQQWGQRCDAQSMGCFRREVEDAAVVPVLRAGAAAVRDACVHQIAGAAAQGGGFQVDKDVVAIRQRDETLQFPVEVGAGHVPVGIGAAIGVEGKIHGAASFFSVYNS